MRKLFGRSSPTASKLVLQSPTASPSTSRTIPGGNGDDYFYGISLSTYTSFWEAPSWQIIGCLLIIVAILVQSAYSNSSADASPLRRRWSSDVMSFWTMIFAITIAISETTLVPLLSTIIYTRMVYPYFVVITHCIVSAASYRSRHEQQTEEEKNKTDASTSSTIPRIHYLQSLVLSFFLYGFGGSIVSDLLMGLPVTALAHPRIIPCYILGWTLVWYCPFDFVYTSYNNPTSAIRYVLKVGEAIDAVTTPMGRISRGARELRNNQITAPVMGGVLAGVGGAFVRQVVGETLPSPHQPLEGLEAAFWKTLCYSLLWWYLAVYQCLANTDDVELQQRNHCNDYNGNDMIRVLIVVLHTIWTILIEVGWVSGHPFVWICRNVVLGRLAAFVVRIFQLGPLPFYHHDESSSEAVIVHVGLVNSDDDHSEGESKKDD